ncbi:MAG: DUF2795 domain-containing protein [Thermoleophilia bacterium]
MSIDVSALETMLDGVALPARPQELLAHARRLGASADELRALEELPDRRYASLNDVAERLRPVQPRFARPGRTPRPESGAPRAEAAMRPEPAGAG